MKILKYSLLTLVSLALLAAAGIAWSLRAPSSAEVCANQLKLVEAELSQRDLPMSGPIVKELIGTTPESCVHDVEFRRNNSTRSPIKIAAELRCLESASQLSELDACR
ncbi:hypothetical protein [Pseudomarimonas arenosa]|uniref:Integron gene cassette protein n=1 Tax=Pseudomarimonas arenosa TaxID=2774145 RepID=A0AAW3ZPP8_9GAMM|nr:hypothetical protein [Pseudomarimonas arenosa]MBD8527072.1 hypothetical protein [Pseudomarimonas arenosa]